LVWVLPSFSFSIPRCDRFGRPLRHLSLFFRAVVYDRTEKHRKIIIEAEKAILLHCQTTSTFLFTHKKYEDEDNAENMEENVNSDI
jgi:hypothetical protein